MRVEIFRFSRRKGIFDRPFCRIFTRKRTPKHAVLSISRLDKHFPTPSVSFFKIALHFTFKEGLFPLSSPPFRHYITAIPPI